MGLAVQRLNPGFGAAFAKKLREYRYGKGTIRNYVAKVEAYRSWLVETGVITGGQDLTRADVHDLLDYADTLPHTYATQMSLYSAVTCYWKIFHQGRNCPAKSLRIPKPPRMVWKGLEKEDALKMLEAAKAFGPRPHAAVCLMYYAGLRNLEAASLPANAMKEGNLYVMGKGDVPRVIPVHQTLEAAINELETGLWMFPGRTPRTHVSSNTINVWTGLASAAAGLGKVTPHQLRHTYAAWLNDTFGDLRATAELMGHSPKSLDVTAGYTRTKGALQREMIDSL